MESQGQRPNLHLSSLMWISINPWLLIPFKDAWVQCRHLQLSTCSSQLLLVLSFCGSRAHLGSDNSICHWVSNDTPDPPWVIAYRILTAVWFYSVWHLLYQTYPECLSLSWLNVIAVRRLFSEPSLVLNCEKGLVPSRCLHLSSHNCC